MRYRRKRFSRSRRPTRRRSRSRGRSTRPIRIGYRF